MRNAADVRAALEGIRLGLTPDASEPLPDASAPSPPA